MKIVNLTFDPAFILSLKKRFSVGTEYQILCID